ncbi:amidohydrolase [Natronolimnobius baerhuensis]|uniref:N-acyl-L-amino acid amidohydrolase n=1 Tax=Natronolimnobius baerhuensis TaxID=253108 RepID=A0A202E3Q6_9EURY|nr:amidohydrolase [Natronolimnobius baerhuensis]OVE82844.1 N-acyl-L-amino acid amidohydrolase [Natronolimnobius baerhuensis]
MGQLDSLSLTEIRRDLHRYPESGWKEFRTTALLAEELDERGFDLFFGGEALDETARLGVPPADEISAARKRARRNGAPACYLDQMDGITGLVAEKRYGSAGPTVGVRIDIDALEIREASDDDHRPARLGFASEYSNTMHACGHDGHTSIGLGLARAIDEEGGFDGTLKLFFQPAEEGGRGGKPMSRSGHLDDVEYFFALHLGLGNETGTIIAGYEHPQPNAKLDVTFSGESSHAGKAPEDGRNALQALSAAIQNLYAIPRHSDGVTRINIGHVESPNPQSVVSDAATMRIEVRGGSIDLKEYMLERAERTVRHAGAMHSVDVETDRYGETTTFTADDELIDLVATAAADVPTVDRITRRQTFAASEDASYLIRRVQNSGGVATYLGIGASNVAGHHNSHFDIDETALELGVAVLAASIRSLDGD